MRMEILVSLNVRLLSLYITFIMRSAHGFLLVACGTLYFTVRKVQGTNIKWTAGDGTAATARDHRRDNGKEDARTAPRSQRYWDEHGIERPDYAKTDAELASERRQSSSASGKSPTLTTARGTFLFTGATLLAVMGGVLALLVHFKILPMSATQGRRLNSRSLSGYVTALLQATSSDTVDEREKARRARLERFRESLKES
jgi:hypothetical protein